MFSLDELILTKRMCEEGNWKAYLDDGQFCAFGHDYAEVLSSISSKNNLVICKKDHNF